MGFFDKIGNNLGNILGITGAAVGGAFGGPGGAALGMGIGKTVGGVGEGFMSKPTVPEGQKNLFIEMQPAQRRLAQDPVAMKAQLENSIEALSTADDRIKQVAEPYIQAAYAKVIEAQQPKVRG